MSEFISGSAAITKNRRHRRRSQKRNCRRRSVATIGALLLSACLFDQPSKTASPARAPTSAGATHDAPPLPPNVRTKTPAHSPLIRRPSVRSERLPSGLTLTLLAQPGQDLAAIELIVLAGGIDARPGVAELTAEISAIGGAAKMRKLGDFERAVGHLGSQIEIGISAKATHFSATVQRAQLGAMLALMGRMLASPRLSLRGFVASKRRFMDLAAARARDDPGWLIEESIQRLALQHHRATFSGAINATLIELSNVRSAALKHFYDRHYRLQNIHLVVAGNMMWNDLKQLAGTAISVVVPRNKSAHRRKTGSKTKSFPQAATYLMSHPGTPRPTLATAFVLPLTAHAQAALWTELFAAFLSHNTLFEHELITNWYALDRHIVATIHTSVDQHQVIEASQALRDLHKRLPTLALNKQLVAAAKERLAARHLRKRRHVGWSAHQIAKLKVLGLDDHATANHLAKILKLTPNTLQDNPPSHIAVKASHAHSQPSKQAVWIVGDKEKLLLLLREKGSVAVLDAQQAFAATTLSELHGKTYDFSYDKRHSKNTKSFYDGRLFVHARATKNTAQLPLLVFLHGTNAERIKYRWMGGGREGDLRGIISKLIDSKRIPPMILAAPSTTIPAAIVQAHTSWPAFDLDRFVALASERLHGVAQIDRSRIIVAGHSGAGCNSNGGLLATLEAKTRPMAVLAIDTCLAVPIANRLARAHPEIGVIVSFQTQSWTRRPFGAFRSAFQKATESIKHRAPKQRIIDHRRVKESMPHDAMVHLTLDKWLPRLIGITSAANTPDSKASNILKRR